MSLRTFDRKKVERWHDIVSAFEPEVQQHLRLALVSRIKPVVKEVMDAAKPHDYYEDIVERIADRTGLTPWDVGRWFDWRYEFPKVAGEHEGIVDPKIWERVQRILKRNGTNGGRGVRNRHGALLKGILRCAPARA